MFRFNILFYVIQLRFTSNLGTGEPVPSRFLEGVLATTQKKLIHTCCFNQLHDYQPPLIISNPQM
jgi:hypothetical protein